MAWRARIDRFVPDLSAALARFPVAALVSVLLCAWVNLQGTSGDFDWQMIDGAAAAFMASGAAHLYAEGLKLSRATSSLLAAMAAMALGLLAFLPGLFHTNHLFVFAGLLPVLMISAYLRRDAAQGAIWLFNLRLGLAGLLAGLVALLFALGLSAILGALGSLFGLSIDGFDTRVWTTACTLVAPLYGLSLVPRDLDERIDVSLQRGSLLDRGVSVLVNYVAVPVIAVYALILHAYAVKIIIDGKLPNGQLGTMVSIFAIGGTAAWLVAWPWREQGTWLLRMFMRIWFFLLLVPAVLLSLAVWRRLADYGVTPDRYGVALVAVWVAALTVYLAIRRNRADMRAILGGAAVLLLVSAAGPWGANGLTITSQFARLERLLSDNGVLKDGKIAPKGLLPSEVASRGSSILYALKDVEGLKRIERWFTGTARNPFDSADSDWVLAQSLSERFGFTQASLSPDFVNFNANAAASFDVAAGGRVTGPFTALQVFDGSPPQQPMTAVFDATDVTVRLEDASYSVAQIRLLEMAKAALADGVALQGPIAVELAPGVTMLIDQIFGNLVAPQPLSSLRFWIIRRPLP